MATETELRRALRSALRELDLEPRAYSGRGMMGRQCLGVELDRGADELRLGLRLARVLTDREEGGRTALEELIRLRSSRDQLGRGWILYWESLPWTDEDE